MPTKPLRAGIRHIEAEQATRGSVDVVGAKKKKKKQNRKLTLNKRLELFTQHWLSCAAH
jgi:hypothetical protein